MVLVSVHMSSFIDGTSWCNSCKRDLLPYEPLSLIRPAHRLMGVSEALCMRVSALDLMEFLYQVK